MATSVQGTATAQLGPAFDYSFAKRTQPRADDFNKRWDDINRRLQIQEGFIPDYQAALTLFLTDTLNRIDEFLRPAYIKLASIAQLGAIFSITSTSPVSLGLGIKQFSVDPDLKDQFASAAYIVGTSKADPTIGLAGSLVSYDRDVGVLTLEIETFNGAAGTVISDWQFNAAADFNNFTAYVQTQIAALRSDLVGGADDFMNSFREVEDRLTALVGTATAAGDTLGELQATISGNMQDTINRIAAVVGSASTAGDTLGELEARIVAMLGTADTAGDTLGELEALIKKANKKAVVMATALG